MSKIIKFTHTNGQTVYAIRKFFFFYKDITCVSRQFWWTKCSKWFKDCITTDRELILEKFTNKSYKLVREMYGKPVTVQQLVEENEELLDDVTTQNKLRRLGLDEDGW